MSPAVGGLSVSLQLSQPVRNGSLPHRPQGERGKKEKAEGKLTRYVSVGTNVLPQLTHKRDTKPTNLAITPALGVEIRPTLPAAHVQARQRILEHLLEAQELQHAQIDARVKAQAALVGAQGRVVLDTVARVELRGAGVVLPEDAELDDAFGDGGDGQRALVLRVGVEEGAVFERGGELGVGLLELGFAGEGRHYVFWDPGLVYLMSGVL